MTDPILTLAEAAMVLDPPVTEQQLRAMVTALGWAADYITDRDWFIQKAIAWWVRDLSKHDAPRARAFLDAHGANLKSFARKEAARFLG